MSVTNRSLKEIPFSPPTICDEDVDAVIKVLKSGWITTGPKVQEFEQEISEYCGTKKSIALNSATACMELCLRLLGVGPGDEVITSAYTYTASASVINHVGAKIVLVDVESDSLELNYEQVEESITNKTKVIIPVDVAGILCNYDKLFDIVKRKKSLYAPNNDIQKQFSRVVILSDAAHSFGATRENRRSGSWADFTSFSFHAVKNLTTAEGGALTWKSLGDEFDTNIYETLKMLSLHGQTKDAFSKIKKGSWEYDIKETGFKCNMTDIQAALGVSQLKRYPASLKRRKEVYELYKENLKNEKEITVMEHNNSSYHLLITFLSGHDLSRDEIIERFADKGIAVNVHYKPLPLLSAYKNLGFNIDLYPISYNKYVNEISLPLNTEITNDEIKYVSETYAGIVKEMSEK